MSTAEKNDKNVWRFSKEVSFGDLMIVIGFLIAAVQMHDQVANHEQRLGKAEERIEHNTSRINSLDTGLAVLVSHGDQNHGATQLRSLKGDQ
jgi:hypothetical protein